MTLVSSVVSEIVGGGAKNGPPLAVRVTKISVAVRVLGVQLHVFCCKIFSHTPTGKKVTPLLSNTPTGGWIPPPPRIFQIKFLPLGVKRYNLVHLVQDT